MVSIKRQKVIIFKKNLLILIRNGKMKKEIKYVFYILTLPVSTS